MCVRMCVWAFVEHQFFWAFSQAPLSLHECVCLSRSQPLSMCVIVSVCLRQRERVGDERWQRARRQRLRQRCCGSSSISSLLSGPWATQLPQSFAAPPSPELRICYALHRHICFNLPLTPLVPRLSKSGLNKPQGCAPDKQTNKEDAKMPIMYLLLSLSPHGDWGAHTLLIVARHRERQLEGGRRKARLRCMESERKRS